jgi:hypothetical protein
VIGKLVRRINESLAVVKAYVLGTTAPQRGKKRLVKLAGDDG